MSCPDDDTIVDLLAGRLDDAARLSLLLHLDGCDDCRHLVADAGAFDSQDAAATESVADDLPEALLGRGASIGRYLVSRVVGVGAMGVVYAAHDPQLGRDVAVKLLRREAKGDRSAADARDVMLREAQTLARLSHPNVIAVHDADVHDDHVFIVMELVDGRTLREWLAEARRTWPEIRDVFVQIGRGLEAAHATGLVHRDVKPDNVLVGRDGRVRVTDFGLARWASAGPRPSPAAIARAAQRSSTSLVGTPAYMSPEQLAGLRVDARSDVFSFCMTLYEAIYGARPFDGRSFEGPAPAAAPLPPVVAPPARGVSLRARRAIERGLAAEREARPTMGALLAAIAHRSPFTAPRLAIAAALLVAASATAILIARHGAADPAAQCTGGEAAWGDGWNAAQRDAARARTLRIGGPTAADEFAQLDSALGGFRRDWIAMHEDACLAHARGEQSSAILDRRMACLETRRRQANALAANVAGLPEDDFVMEQASIARQLPPVADCAESRRDEDASTQFRPARSPAAVLDPDGKLELFVIGAGGSAWRVRELGTGYPPTWGGWTRIGAPSGLRTMVAAIHKNASVELTAIDGDGVVRGAYSPTGGELADASWGRAADGRTLDVAVAGDASERHHTFRIVRGGSADGVTVVHAEELYPGTGAADPTTIAIDGASQVIAINDARDGSGRVHAFVVARGRIWHTWQPAPGAPLAPPVALDGDLDARGLSAAVNGDGRLELLALDPSGRPYHRFVTAPSLDAALPSSWSAWQPLGTAAELVVLRPYGDGPGLGALGVTRAGGVITLWQHDRLSVWNKWWEDVILDRSMGKVTDVRLARDGAGHRFQVAIASGGQIWLRWNDPKEGGTWHGWLLL